MSLLITVDTNPNFAPKNALPVPDAHSGNPSFKTWAAKSRIIRAFPQHAAST